MPLVLLDSIEKCAAEAAGLGCRLLDGETAAVFACSRDTTLVIRYCGIGGNASGLRRTAIPGVCTVRIDKHGEVSAEGCRAIVWGELIQIILYPEYVIDHRGLLPEKLGECEAFYKGSPVRAELYRDNGTRLAIVNERGALLNYYAVGTEHNGSISKLETGGNGMLAIRLIDAGANYHNAEQRLLLIDENMNEVLNVSAERAEISEGRPTIVEKLPTLCGFERRTQFDIKTGAAEVFARETGVFTHKRVYPQTNAACALCLMQSIAAGLTDECGQYLSNELTGALSAGEIERFIGSFTLSVLTPKADADRPSLFKSNFYHGAAELALTSELPFDPAREDEEVTVTVGAIGNDGADSLLGRPEAAANVIVPRRFELHMAHGKTTDIVEL